jgi:uncharacterized membrane protein YphA (DoxX/SURF4 family)
MSSVRWRPVLVVILRLTIALLFVPPVLSKLQEPGKWAHQFVVWGYPAWGAVATTVVEILGLIALWIPRLVSVAIAVLIVVLLGAASTWLIHGPRNTAAYPGIILMFLAGLAWLEAMVRRPSRKA